MLTLLFKPTDNSDVVKLKFEHSLVSLSKWESFYEKPFFSREAQTIDETNRYIAFMLASGEEPENFFEWITPEHVSVVHEYINSKQTATTFREDPSAKPSNEIITGEVMYQWLVTFNIPFDPVETWHLSRMMTLVKICGIKQSKPKKMSRTEQIEQQRRLNEERRRNMGTSG